MIFFSNFLTEVNNAANTKPSLDALEYLRDKNSQITMLNSHPIVRKMYIKYNAALPSSAVVERLFSKALVIYTPRRNRLLSKTFERLLFVRHNKDLL